MITAEHICLYKEDWRSLGGQDSLFYVDVFVYAQA